MPVPGASSQRVEQLPLNSTNKIGHSNLPMRPQRLFTPAETSSVMSSRMRLPAGSSHTFVTVVQRPQRLLRGLHSRRRTCRRAPAGRRSSMSLGETPTWQSARRPHSAGSAVRSACRRTPISKQPARYAHQPFASFRHDGYQSSAISVKCHMKNAARHGEVIALDGQA